MKIDYNTTKKKKTEYFSITIRELYEDYLKTNSKYWTDVSPTGQRPDIQMSDNGGSNPSKSQEIIASVFNLINDFYIETLGTLLLTSAENVLYQLESVDGGHRKRGIKNFIENKFPLHKSSPLGEIYFKDLTNDQKKYFWNTTIDVKIVYDLNSNQKSYMFMTTNKTTDVNAQEMRNSFGNILIANLIRNMVRKMENELFEHSINEEKDRAIFKYLNFDNNRLKIEEMVARMVYLIISGGKTSSDEEMLKMYETDFSENDISNLKKKLKKLLNFLLELCKSRKKIMGHNGMPSKEFTFLYRFYFYLNYTYKDKWIIDDYDSFYKNFSKLYLRIVESKEFAETLYKNDENTIKKNFTGKLGAHDTDKHFDVPIDIFLDNIDINDLVLLLDKKRVATPAEKELQLSKQDFKCYIDEKDLSFSAAVGAHDIPHIKGGKTDIHSGNLLMIREVYNQHMKEILTVSEYKNVYIRLVKKGKISLNEFLNIPIKELQKKLNNTLDNAMVA